MKKHRIGALIAASAMVLTFAGSAFAQDGNQTNVASGDATVLCTGGPGGDITPIDGKVAWVFVHAGKDIVGPGTLTANFVGAGQQTADSYVQGGIKYLIWTDAPETLSNFSDTIEGGVLTLSHVCLGETVTTTTSDESSTTTTTSDESSTTTTTTSDESSTTTTSDESSTTSTLSSETTGSVSNSSEEKTPPSTDTISSGDSGTSSGSLLALLVGATGVLAGVLLLSPRFARRGR